MILGLSISCVFEVVYALLGWKGTKKLSDFVVEAVDCACSCFAQHVFELCEDLLDGVQVR
jgi:hypothetical protein